MEIISTINEYKLLSIFLNPTNKIMIAIVKIMKIMPRLLS